VANIIGANIPFKETTKYTKDVAIIAHKDPNINLILSLYLSYLHIGIITADPASKMNTVTNQANGMKKNSIYGFI
jgi:hypothetical protein